MHTIYLKYLIIIPILRTEVRPLIVCNNLNEEMARIFITEQVAERVINNSGDKAAF